ncbi:bestrophin-like domain [Amycolatopsis sp. NPDC054798]
MSATALVGWLAVGLRRTRLGVRRQRWHDQTTGPCGALFNALFLAAFAMSAIIAWQNYDHARDHVVEESTSLLKLSTGVSMLPDGARLRGEVVSYLKTVVDDEWPLLPHGKSSENAYTALTGLYTGILTTAPRDSAATTACSEAAKYWSAAFDARQARLRDSTTELPLGLLLCVVITALLVVGHSLIMGLPHSLSSLIPLLAKTATVTAAIVLLVLIRHPYQGPLTIDTARLDHVREEVHPTGQ